MDKQLIELAAIAAMCAVATSGQMGDASDDELSAIANMNEKDKALTVALFSEFLARIDAERGKLCVCREPTSLGVVHRVNGPCFISPTIPEGMARAAEKVNYFDAQKIADEYGLDYNKFCAAHSAMLAAAQGERNAD